MNGLPKIALDELMAPNAESLDPTRFPNEAFDLYSIPAFDNGRPDVVFGREIGSSKQVVQPNDVLLSRIVPHIRRAWVVGEQRGRRQIASGEWIIFRSAKTDPNYLRYLFVEDGFHARFMNTVAGVGGSLLRARPAQVGDIEVSLPALSEQRQIADQLEQADRLVCIRRYAIELTTAFLPAAFLELFGDPTRSKEGWSSRRVEELCELVRGSSPRPQGDPRYFGGPIPRLMIADITRDGTYVTPRIDSLTVEGASRSRKMLAGSVVMAVSGAVGLPAILRSDACIHDGFVGFRTLSSDVLPIVFYYALLLRQAANKSQAAGAIWQNLTTEQVNDWKISIPPLPLQRRFADLAEGVERLRGMQQEALRQAEHLFASLLYLAFGGEEARRVTTVMSEGRAAAA